MSELQIRVGTEDNAKIIFLISHQNILLLPLLEPSRRDGSNDESQNVFLEKNGKLFLNYPCYPSYLEDWELFFLFLN